LILLEKTALDFLLKWGYDMNMMMKGNEMNVLLGDRVRWFDTRTETWIRGEVVEIRPCRTQKAPFYTIETLVGDRHVLLGTDWHLNHIDFRVRFRDVA